MRWWRWPGGGVLEAEYSVLEDAPNSNNRKQLRLCNPEKVVLLLFGVSVLIYMYYTLSEEISKRFLIAFITNTTGIKEKHLSIDSAGCHVPKLNPWDPSILPFIKPSKINCSKGSGPPLVASNTTSLYIVQSAVPYYNTSVWCCYQPCIRAKREDDIVKSKNCFRFSQEVLIDLEFVIVHCYVGNTQVYEDYHSFVPRKPQVEKRCEKLSSRFISFKSTTLNILILGLDALSRLNFHRQMPLTVSLLKRMGAVEMLEYNKVGENTFPNLVPVLTGMDVQELKKACWPRQSSFFDNCRFIWDEYLDVGYRTAFVEESIGGIFTYRMRGFAKQPTDYYLRHFNKAMLQKIGLKEAPKFTCSGSRLTTEVYLSYVKKFYRTFKLDRYFAFFWSTVLSHDYLNNPKLGDEIYMDLLLEMQASGALERTVLAVMSDHGYRMGGIRFTYQGRLEDRLPFLFLVFPNWFRKKYPAAVANAQRNAHRLTTHFDLHETLSDLMRTSELLSEEVLERRSKELKRTLTSIKGLPRGISLFLPVPSTRTCRQAGINKHYCTCLNGTAVDRNDIMYNRTVNYLMLHINQLISSRRCHTLHVDKVYLVNEEKITDEKGRDIAYLVIMETSPGGAQFEGTMYYDKTFNKFSVVGSVDRINRYREQSRCVKNSNLKKYCFCKRHVSKGHKRRHRSHKIHRKRRYGKKKKNKQRKKYLKHRKCKKKNKKWRYKDRK